MERSLRCYSLYLSFLPLMSTHKRSSKWSRIKIEEWKKVQGARHITPHHSTPGPAMLPPCTSSSRSHQGSPVMERTRDPPKDNHPQSALGPTLREREIRTVRLSFCTSQLALSHCLSCSSHLGAGSCNWAGGHRAGLGTRKLMWPNYGEGVLMGDGCGDSQVH